MNGSYSVKAFDVDEDDYNLEYEMKFNMSNEIEQ